MHTNRRTKTRTRSVTAKVTPEEEKRFLDFAKQDNLTLSEWSRHCLLRAAEVSAETRLLLSEVLSLRRLFLTMQVDVLRGEIPTEQRLKELIEKAEKEKFAIADQRIHAYQKSVGIERVSDQPKEVI